VVFVWAFSATSSYATPIDYEFRTLTDGVEASDFLSPTGAPSESDYAHYWKFEGDLGDNVTVTVRRLRPDFDPLFWVFFGLYDDTTDFGTFIDTGDGGYRHQVDDGLPPNGGGLGFDPQFTFALTSTGPYTVIVTEGPLTSEEAEGSFGYTILAQGFDDNLTPVPEASSALSLLAGLGALAVGYRRSRK
jgi:hypothetical protein